MIAVLGWCDGFGNDGYVKAICSTYEKAKEFHDKENDRWVEFNFGKVDFDWYEANEFRNEKHKSKKGRKNK